MSSNWREMETTSAREIEAKAALDEIRAEVDRLVIEANACAEAGDIAGYRLAGERLRGACGVMGVREQRYLDSWEEAR